MPTETLAVPMHRSTQGVSADQQVIHSALQGKLAFAERQQKASNARRACSGWRGGNPCLLHPSRAYPQQASQLHGHACSDQQCCVTCGICRVHQRYAGPCCVRERITKAALVGKTCCNSRVGRHECGTLWQGLNRLAHVTCLGVSDSWQQPTVVRLMLMQTLASTWLNKSRDQLLKNNAQSQVQVLTSEAESSRSPCRT